MTQLSLVEVISGDEYVRRKDKPVEYMPDKLQFIVKRFKNS